MIASARAVTALLVATLAAGCAGPMSQREAVEIATARLDKYCGASPGCKPMRVTHTQKIKDRWLIEFETPANAFGIAVASDGNTDVSIWDKSRNAAAR